MEKVYYKGLEIKKGFEFNYHGLKTVVTQELIDNNPELFKVVDETQHYFKCLSKRKGSSDWTVGRIYKIEKTPDYPKKIVLMSNTEKRITIPLVYNGVYVVDEGISFIVSDKKEFDKQELLDEARRYYPVGTVCKTISGSKTFTVESELVYSETGSIICPIGGLAVYSKSPYVEKWAEKLPLKFTTEDNVDIYGDMKTYAVGEDLKLFESDTYDGYSSDHKYFYHKENALAYIKDNTQKTLEDYENILFDNMSTFTFAPERAYFSVWGWIKDEEPKLYYTKILQLIADDLNDIRHIHERGQASFHINKAGGVNVHMGADEGAVYFKSKKLAEKAREILGDKINYLYNEK